jgi:hypothetical protein
MSRSNPASRSDSYSHTCARSVPAYGWLFAQSNFGVVTRMTIWLMPAPEYLYPYRLGIKALSALGARKAPGSRAFLSKLKAAIDLNHILVPGRYV